LVSLPPIPSSTFTQTRKCTVLYPQILFTNIFTPHNPASSKTGQESPLQTGHESPTQNKIPSKRKKEKKILKNEELRTRENPSAFPSNPQGYGGVKNPTPPSLSLPSCHA
jgi:hypothetical protein